MSTQQFIRKILLADDDADDRYFFEKAVETIPDKINLVMVNDGEKLINYLEQNLATLPHLVFIDMNMPRKNGLECLIAIKNIKALQHIPLVIYSTSLRDETSEQLYQSGAHYYINKCQYSKLAESIIKIINLLAENPEQPAKENFVLKY